MNTNGQPHNKDPNVVASFTDLAHDVVELAELQTQLLTLDVSAAWQRMRIGLALLIVGVCLLLGCIPIALLTLAEALVEFAEWSRTAALALAGVVGLLAAIGTLATAWQRIQTMFATFERSREELRRNLAWIKSTLKRQPAPRRAERSAGVTIPS